MLERATNLGPEGSLMLEGVRAERTTLDQLVVAFETRRWRVDRASGRTASPTGVRGIERGRDLRAQDPAEASAVRCA